MAEQKAKYEEIVEWIIGKIDRHELSAGAKIPSENELVTIFGVSRQTVRHAVSVLENRGLVERRRGSGTYICDGEREESKARTMRIAIVTTYVDEYIFPGMLKELEKLLSKNGYNLQIAFTHNTVERERTILESFLRDSSIDGIIAETTKSGIPNPNISIYHKLQERGIPIVFLNSYYKELDAIHVSLNDFAAGKIVTEHLLQCGHQKIAGIFKSDDGQGHLRYAGYMEALMERDIRVRSKRIAWIDTDDLNEMWEDRGRYLRRLKDCTACVCYNDEVANNLVAICKDANLDIPNQLSIISIDNSDLAGYCDVPLTSANNPILDLARIAADQMLKLLENENGVESIELKPELVIRNSVKIVNSLE